jgi:hypothetical protein
MRSLNMTVCELVHIDTTAYNSVILTREALTQTALQAYSWNLMRQSNEGERDDD